MHGVKMPGLSVLEGLTMYCVLDRIQMSGLEPVEIKDLVVEGDCGGNPGPKRDRRRTACTARGRGSAR